MWASSITRKQLLKTYIKQSTVKCEELMTNNKISSWQNISKLMEENMYTFKHTYVLRITNLLLRFIFILYIY